MARQLAACGVRFAPPDGCDAGDYFVRVNDCLLTAFDGAWDLPPRFPDGWERDGRFDRLGRTLVARFRGAGAWAWHDPRTALTLRFWRHLIPDLRVVVCVRDPAAVAASLGDGPEALAPSTTMALWELYYRYVLREAPPDRVVTCFDRWIDDPTAESLRVLTALGLEAPASVVGAAAATVRPERRRYRGERRFAGAEPLRRLYRKLLIEAEAPAPRVQGSAPAARIGDDRMASRNVTLMGFGPSQMSNIAAANSAPSTTPSGLSFSASSVPLPGT